MVVSKSFFLVMKCTQNLEFAPPSAIEALLEVRRPAPRPPCALHGSVPVGSRCPRSFRLSTRLCFTHLPAWFFSRSLLSLQSPRDWRPQRASSASFPSAVQTTLPRLRPCWPTAARTPPFSSKRERPTSCSHQSSHLRSSKSPQTSGAVESFPDGTLQTATLLCLSKAT